MNIAKRIVLFLAMNIAVLLVLSIVLWIIQYFTGYNVTASGSSMTGLMIYSLIYWFIGSFISLWLSKWMAKRAYNIQLLDVNNIASFSEKEKVVYDVIRELSNKHDIKLPEIGVYNSIDANAFATGATKNSSLVAVSSWLLNKMSTKEIEWVIAHEMSHIINGDMVTMTLLQWVLNAFVIFFARIFAYAFDEATDGKFGWIWYYVINMILQVLLGVLASVIAMSFSRYREFRADEGSAKAVGKEKMIAALQALKNMYDITPTDSEAGKMAAFQINTKKSSGIMQLFASHPSLDDRIKNIETFNY